MAATGAVLAAGGGLLPGTLGASAAVRKPGSLPFPSRPAGSLNPDLTPELANIDHIVLAMNENHSFDAYMGMLPWRVASKACKVDGFQTLGTDGIPKVFQGDEQGNVYRSFPAQVPCQIDGYPHPRGPGNNNGWEGSHKAFNGGALDGYVRVGGEAAMEYWDDQHLLGFLYSLASYFPVGDRYFSSTLCPTYPNRVFAFTGSAGGITSTDTPPPDVFPPNGRIFDVLEAYGISWADYFSNLPSAGLLGKTWAAQRIGTHFFPGSAATIDGTLAEMEAKLATNTLESVVVAEQVFTEGDEEPPQNMLTGQYFFYKLVSLFMKYPEIWSRTMLILNYDESGGFYDHVPPPAALSPGDGTHPNLPQSQWFGDDYTRLGFRVPNVVVSPWAKDNFVSHKTYDHTSVLATIQAKWNLPALTYRDANANDMRDFLKPNRGLNIEQAPFGDPSKIVLVPAPVDGPTGNPVVDSQLCANTKDATAGTFPPAVSGPDSVRPGVGPASRGGAPVAQSCAVSAGVGGSPGPANAGSLPNTAARREVFRIVAGLGGVMLGGAGAAIALRQPQPNTEHEPASDSGAEDA
jgi:phospholipase C